MKCAALAVMAFLMLNVTACGQGDNMFDSCFQERKGHDASAARRLGFSRRGLGAHDPVLLGARERERIAARKLSECETRVALTH